MAKEQALQDAFLNTLCKSRETVSVYLVNGIRLQGQIESFDRFVVMVKDPATRMTRMVYKHAISTVAPVRAAEAPGRAGDDDTRDAN